MNKNFAGLILCLAFVAQLSAQLSETVYKDSLQNLFGSGDFEQGAALLEEAIKTYPNNTDFYSIRLVVNLDAEEVSDRLLADAQKVADGYNLHDTLFVELASRFVEDSYPNSYVRAITLTDYALRQYPNSYNLWAVRSEALFELERYEEAFTSIEKAIALKPDFLYGLLQKARLQFQIGNHDAAFATVEDVLKISPNLSDAYDLRTDFYDDLGDFEKAFEQNSLALQNAQNVEQEAYYLSRRSTLAESFGDLREACRLAALSEEKGNSFAFLYLSADCNLLWVSKGTLLTYDVVDDEGKTYQFIANVSHFAPDSIAFFWNISYDEDFKGSIEMGEKALTEAFKQHNFFQKKQHLTLDDKTTVWVSQMVYQNLDENEMAEIDTGTGLKTFKRVAEEAFSVFDEKLGKEVNVTAWKVQTEDGKETLWIHSNPENPIIIKMDLGWSIVLKKIK